MVLGGAARYGDEFVGILDGWLGLIENHTTPLDPDQCRSILTKGGTILGSSRTNPFATDDGAERVEAAAAALGLDAVVAIGGDDTLGAADRLYQRGLPVVGVPKTIDNDLSGTEVTFGFDTAVQIATEAIDRLQTTAESHHRVIVCEVMGRHVGWIAVHAGMAGGAAEILIPEVPFSLDAVCDRLRQRHDGGQFFSTVVVAEGALPRDEGAASLRRSQRTGPGRPVRPRPPRRDRGLLGRGDRATNRIRVPVDGARAHPAGRVPDGIRSGAGHPVRRRGPGRRPRP